MAAQDDYFLAGGGVPQACGLIVWAVRMVLPSGLKATVTTGASWRRMAISRPVAVSHKRAV